MRVLYGSNTFYFDMVNDHRKKSPPSLIDNGGYHIYHEPNSRKPDNFGSKVLLTAIAQIQQRVPLKDLLGWVYFDHFLRFLYSIGASNAALLRTLRFKGIVKIHRICDSDHCGLWSYGWCDHDLVESLRTYIPFIRKLCTNVERIEIIAVKDDIFDPEDEEQWLPDSAPRNRGDALGPLLNNELRQISSLNELAVFNIDDKSSLYEPARSAIKFFQDRTKNRDQEKCEIEKMQNKAKHMGNSNTHCSFCGEGHLWAECHNLRNFCGEFGHWRQSCPKLAAADVDKYLDTTFGAEEEN